MSDRSFLERWSLDFDDAGFVEGTSPGSRNRVAFQLRLFPTREDDPYPEDLRYLGQQLE